MKFKIFGCIFVFVVIIIIYAIMNSGPQSQDNSDTQYQTQQQ